MLGDWRIYEWDYERHQIGLVMAGVHREVLRVQRGVAIVLIGVFWAGSALGFDHTHRLWKAVLRQHVYTDCDRSLNDRSPRR